VIDKEIGDQNDSSSDGGRDVLIGPTTALR
jgi:hypothetical protein